MYGDMGFSRVVLGREVSLAEIEAIKKAAPHIEIEAFVHGAMCLAYSGRCFLSAWMTGRSGNDGTCAHSCRWDYRVLEEEKRPGEYYPVIENEGFTSILSSKDICMIDYLKEMGDAGVDSLKIEGRMKSIYYTAVVTRAYRKALDRLAGKDIPDYQGYRDELEKVSHREFSTGFYFGREEIEKSTEISYQRQYIFMGSLGKELSPGRFELDIKNKIRRGGRTGVHRSPTSFICPTVTGRSWTAPGRNRRKRTTGKNMRSFPGFPPPKGISSVRRRSSQPWISVSYLSSFF